MLVWRGNSRLNNEPIMLILADGKSDNRKTGPMVQSYILPDDGRAPVAHVRDGTDTSVCPEACPFRAGKGCYVDVGRSVGSTWRANKARTIATEGEVRARLVGNNLRMGAYGDPSAVPFEVWERLVSYASGHTGYTHAWRDENNAAYAKLCMASCESANDAAAARAQGWRTFRVVADYAKEGHEREIICPAESHGITCDKCRLCAGMTRSGGRNIIIAAHGVRAKKAKEGVK